MVVRLLAAASWQVLANLRFALSQVVIGAQYLTFSFAFFTNVEWPSFALGLRNFFSFADFSFELAPSRSLLYHSFMPAKCYLRAAWPPSATAEFLADPASLPVHAGGWSRVFRALDSASSLGRAQPARLYATAASALAAHQPALALYSFPPH